MADYGFGDPYAAAATNPYLQPQQAPDWRQVLSNALLGVGAGISNADASGRGWGAGIGPGLLMGSQMTNQQQQQQFQRQIQAAQWQQMEAYRRAQEENMRSQIAERELGMGIDRSILGQLNGGGAAPPGMGYQPPPAQMGPDFKKAGQEKVDYLVKNHGMSPTAAAAVVGNLYQESGFNPTAVGDGGTAYGQAQWRGDRQTGLVQFAKAQGKPPADPQVQLDYLVTEMKGGDMGAQRAYALLQQAKSPQEATAAMMHFFRPAGYTPANPTAGHGYQQRVQYAQALLPNGQPVAQGEGGPPGSPAGPNGSMVPQQALNLPPGASAGLDPLSQQMLLSKRFGPLGQARITNQNQQRTQALEEQKFLEQQRANAEKEALDTANAKVNPKTMQPNATLTDAEAKAAAAKAEAEAKVKGDYEAGLKLSEAEMLRYSKEVRPGVEATYKSLPNLYQMKRLSEGPLASGSYIDARQAGARLLDTLGIQPMSDGMVNRTEYNNRAGKNVLAFLQTRALGSGSGISEGDRKFVESLSGRGDFSTEEVKRMTDLAIQSAQNELKMHNEEVVPRLMKLKGAAQAAEPGYWELKPQTFEDWTRANPPAGSAPVPTQQMGSTYTPQLDPANILKNIPKPTDKAAYDALPPGTPYLHPDGTFKMKPKAVKR